MAASNQLLCVPSEIFSSQVAEFLDWADLTRLDTAATNKQLRCHCRNSSLTWSELMNDEPVEGLCQDRLFSELYCQCVTYSNEQANKWIWLLGRGLVTDFLKLSSKDDFANRLIARIRSPTTTFNSIQLCFGETFWNSYHLIDWVLHDCEHVQHLSIHGNPLPVYFVDDTNIVASHMRSLEIDHLSTVSSDCSWLPRLFSNLTRLDIIGDCEDVDDDNVDMEKLPIISNLKYLKLERITIPEVAMVNVIMSSAFPGLESLSLSAQNITDATLIAIANNCHRLKVLSLLEAVKITSFGLQQLSLGCLALAELHINLITIDEQHVIRFNNVRVLELAYNIVDNEKDLEMLVRYMPLLTTFIGNEMSAVELDLVTQYCPNLTKFICFQICDMTCSHLRSLFHPENVLRYVMIDMQAISEMESFLTYAQHLKQLVLIRLSADGICDSLIEELLDCLYLSDLSIYTMGGVSGLNRLSRQFKLKKPWVKF